MRPICLLQQLLGTKVLWHQISRGERSIGRDLARVPEVRTAVDGRESRHAAFRASATPRSASVENGRLRGGESTAYRKNRDSARFTGVSERSPTSSSCRRATSS